MSPIDQIRLNGTSWTEWDLMDRTELNSNYIFWTWNLWFTKWSKDNDSVYWIRIRCNLPIYPHKFFFFFYFTFHLFNFHFLFLLIFLNQWLRLKVAFCNYQSQPFIRIALGAISRVLHWVQFTQIPYKFFTLFTFLTFTFYFF